MRDVLNSILEAQKSIDNGNTEVLRKIEELVDAIAKLNKKTDAINSDLQNTINAIKELQGNGQNKRRTKIQRKG